PSLPASALPITATRVPTSVLPILFSARKGTPFTSALSTARSSVVDEARIPVTLQIAPSPILATAYAPPSAVRQLVTNLPSSATKKPVPVRSSLPDASKTVTKIMAGRTLIASVDKSRAWPAGGWLGSNDGVGD